MTPLLDPSLLQRLRGSKLRVRRAEASGGVGERRSRSIGPGIEFADYREYQPGDDVRYVDRHVFARHRRAVVRRFAVDRQLRATVLLDCSGSMDVGDGSKWSRARALAAAAAAVGVYGGDQVRLGAARAGGIEWYPPLRHPQRLSHAISWIEGLRATGVADAAEVARATLALASPRELLVIVSDWMVDGSEEALGQYAAASMDVVAVQVVSPEEARPDALAHGPLRLADAETGDVLEVDLDADGARRYGVAFRAWQAELRDLVTRYGGRWLATTSDVDLADVVLGSWRREGFVT